MSESTEVAPAGEGAYEVKAGDCIASIAFAHGHAWETIWNDPANAELKTIRKDPYVLLPGDRVTIPPLRRKNLARPTGRKHVFRRVAVPEKLRICVAEKDEPRTNEPYLLAIDDRDVVEAETDAEGNIETWIPPDAREAFLVIGEDAYRIALGALDPAGSRSGAAARLTSLGYLPSIDAGDDAYLCALGAFQKAEGLTESGTLDAVTIAALDTRTSELKPKVAR